MTANLADATGTYPDIIAGGGLLPSVDGLCPPGTYNGPEVITPDLTATFDPTDFEVEVEFKLAGYETIFFGSPIVSVGEFSRFCSINCDPAGLLGIKDYSDNSISYSTFTAAIGTWYTAILKCENGFAELWIDGVQIHWAQLGGGTGFNKKVSTKDYSTFRTYNGCIRNLVISNDTTLAGTYASNTVQGIGCGGGNPQGDGTAYELFTASSPFDLSNTGHSYIWNVDGYILLNTAGAIVPPVGAPTAFTATQTQTITLPFAFPSLEGPITEINVCSEGWFGFGPNGTSDSSESVSDLLNRDFARLAFLWDSLDPSIGGTIHLEAVGLDEFHITFTDVPETGGAGANTVQVALKDTGLIEVRYGACSLLDCLVGLSSGNGATDPGPSDYSDPALSVLFTTGVGPFLPILSLSGATRPVLGTNWDLTVDVIPAGTPLGLHWFASINPNIPDLTSIGIPGCGLYASLVVLGGPWVPTVGTPYNYSLTLPPASPPLIGLELYAQAALFTSPQSNAFGLETTNGIKGKVGDL
tara:strand:+ start:443 stop:2023 length:1581 start_codon:yes stop_codon:yes gene_type:complete